jgi:aryl-alcohol dehydrogenase-like predicted oxidoreductase
MSFIENNKIIYGSAGFGIKNYGFSSLYPASSQNDYLKFIYDIGLHHIDTAPAYGNSDKIIGLYNKKSKKKFKIWTKVGNLIRNSSFTFDNIFKSVKLSQENLNVESFECLYLHQNNIEILEDKFVQKALKEIKEMSLTKKVGVSIYNSSELISSLSSETYDVIQLPVSAANTYLYNLAIKQNFNKTLVARSIFLQGTLLNIDNYSKSFNYLNEIKTIVNLLKEIAYSYKTDYLGMLLSYVMSLESLNYIIVSSRNENNLKQILTHSEIELCEEIKIEINKISNNQNDWANPRNWLF